MKRNIFLVLNGMQTIAIGIFLLIQRYTLLDDHSDRAIHLVHYMGDAEWATVLIVLGSIGFVVGLLDTDRYHIQKIILILLGGIWFAYSLFFIMNDLHFGQPVHLGTILSSFVFIQILFEAYFGGRQ